MGNPSNPPGNPHGVTTEEIDTTLRTARNLAVVLHLPDLADSIDALLINQEESDRSPSRGTGSDGLSTSNYAAAVDLLAQVASRVQISDQALARQVHAFLRDREEMTVPDGMIERMATRPAGSELSEKEQKQWDAESVRTLARVKLARHQAKTDAQVLHNKGIREGVQDAVAEWLVSIFKNRHPSAIPSFDDGTEIKLTLKAGQVAEGEHGETLYQVTVKNETKGVI